MADMNEMARLIKELAKNSEDGRLWRDRLLDKLQAIEDGIVEVLDKQDQFRKELNRITDKVVGRDVPGSAPRENPQYVKPKTVWQGPNTGKRLRATPKKAEEEP